MSRCNKESNSSEAKMGESTESSSPKKETLTEVMARCKKEMVSGDSKKTEAKLQDAITDDYKAADEGLEVIRDLTGIAYDPIMAKHKCEWDTNYPENPQRYLSIIDRLFELNLVDRCVRIFEDDDIFSSVQSVHTGNRIQVLDEICANNLEWLKAEAANYDAIYFNESTADAAKMALALSYSVVKAVASGALQNGIALVRPPGHHAMSSEFCGYCYLNNVAVSARAILDDEELNINKILILDFDVHHGQATQQMFYDTDKVLYISIHRYENGNFWPNLRQSNYDFIGKPDSSGYGYNVNIPLNTIGCGDSEYMAIMTNIVLPMAFEFQPDLIIFSAGYDSCIGCPEFNPDLILFSAGYDCAVGDEKGKMTVTPGFYGHIVRLLSGMAKGKLAVILEGGYYLPSLAEGVAVTLKALLDDPAGFLQPLDKPNASVIDTINNVIGIHHPHWKCFNYKIRPPTELEPLHEMYIRHERGAEAPPFPILNCYPVQSADEIEEFDQIMDRLRDFTIMSIPKKVGYTYSDEMLQHYPKDNSIHPECPERLRAVYKLFKELELDRRLEHIIHKPATVEQMALVHALEFVYKIRRPSMPHVDSIIGKLSGSGDATSSGAHDVYTSPGSSMAISQAAGCVLHLCQALIKGKIGSGIALVRPPGHHAERNCAAGFCLANNIAIAARWIQKISPGERILIVDFDIHHGNGTQHAFYDDDQVLFISIHKFDNARFYPGLRDGGATFTGEGKGKGFNVNIPFNNGKMADADYIAVFHSIILPIAYSFAPTVVLVSAGFDAGIHDRLGNYALSPQVFGHFIQLLRPLAAGQLILAMEGGYNICTLKYGMIMCVKALLGDPLPPLKFTEVCQAAKTTIKEVINIQRKFWPVLDVIRPLTPIVKKIYLKNKLHVATMDEAIGSNENCLNLCYLNRVIFPREFENVPTYN